MEDDDMSNSLKTLALAGALLFAGSAQAAGVPGQGTWEATLLGRDINGFAVDGYSDSAVFLYDTTLNLTWLRNANVNGAMDWGPANAWAKALVVGTYSGWRLPTIVDTGAPGPDYNNAGGTDAGFNVQTKSGDPTKYEQGQTVFSEMAQLWYVELGNKAMCPPGDANCVGRYPPGWGLTNTGDFQSIQSYYYWSDQRSVLDPSDAWGLGTGDGFQGLGPAVHNGLYAFAVRSGDVAVAVPEPETYALMLAGLGVLGVLAGRRRGIGAAPA
jgi:hypothetical protein